MPRPAVVHYPSFTQNKAFSPKIPAVILGISSIVVRYFFDISSNVIEEQSNNNRTTIEEMTKLVLGIKH